MRLFISMTMTAVLLVASASCGGSGDAVCGSSSDAGYRAKYRGMEQQITELLGSNRCRAPVTCGKVSALDCGSEVDGPLYYFETATKCVLEICGGACMASADGGGCVHCPPPEWTCSD